MQLIFYLLNTWLCCTNKVKAKRPASSVYLCSSHSLANTKFCKVIQEMYMLQGQIVVRYI